MEKRIETGWLLDFYGPLLTGRQQQVLALYFEEDLSLGEIAQQEQISRQGVHDILRRAEHQLLAYEQRLGLFSRFLAQQEALEHCAQALDTLPAQVRAMSQIQQVRRRISGLLENEEGSHGL